MPSYLRELVYQTRWHDGPVTDIDRRDGRSTVYHALERRDGRVFRATIDTIYEADDEEREPRVTFASCYPGSDLEALDNWSNLATGECLGPQDLAEWSALFDVFQAAIELFEADRAPDAGAGDEEVVA